MRWRCPVTTAMLVKRWVLAGEMQGEYGRCIRVEYFSAEVKHGLRFSAVGMVRGTTKVILPMASGPSPDAAIRNLLLTTGGAR